MDNLLKNRILNGFKNTELGFIRIKRNLDLMHYTDEQISGLQKKIIETTPLANIETKGKNHYFSNRAHNAVLTINAHSFTIITAKQFSI
ncbi:DUF3781 domain-containing protein [Vibrio parahaemolyticus]|nr:DUF3781 domain-containing protein [Vibrio parahaemolyticus]